MSSESTSTLVLRSPVQGRPAIVWAAVLSQGTRGLELAVTFFDSTVGGTALHLLDGTGLLDASKWGAWLWSHLWMEVADGVLHQECGWMREPIIGPRPRSEKDAAFEFGSVSSGSAVGSGVDGGQGGCLSQGGGEVGASG